MLTICTQMYENSLTIVKILFVTFKYCQTKPKYTTSQIPKMLRKLLPKFSSKRKWSAKGFVLKIDVLYKSLIMVQTSQILSNKGSSIAISFD